MCCLNLSMSCFVGCSGMLQFCLSLATIILVATSLTNERGYHCEIGPSQEWDALCPVVAITSLLTMVFSVGLAVLQGLVTLLVGPCVCLESCVRGLICVAWFVVSIFATIAGVQADIAHLHKTAERDVALTLFWLNTALAFGTMIVLLKEAGECQQACCGCNECDCECCGGHHHHDEADVSLLGFLMAPLIVLRGFVHPQGRRRNHRSHHHHHHEEYYSSHAYGYDPRGHYHPPPCAPPPHRGCMPPPHQPPSCHGHFAPPPPVCHHYPPPHVHQGPQYYNPPMVYAGSQQGPSAPYVTANSNAAWYPNVSSQSSAQPSAPPLNNGEGTSLGIPVISVDVQQK